MRHYKCHLQVWEWNRTKKTKSQILMKDSLCKRLFLFEPAHHLIAQLFEIPQIQFKAFKKNSKFSSWSHQLSSSSLLFGLLIWINIEYRTCKYNFNYKLIILKLNHMTIQKISSNRLEKWTGFLQSANIPVSKILI